MEPPQNPPDSASTLLECVDALLVYSIVKMFLIKNNCVKKITMIVLTINFNH